MSRCRFLASLALTFALIQAHGSFAQEEPKPKEKEDKEALRALLKKADEEYRTKFKKPETAPEYWAAMNYEIEVGKFDLAALFLKGVLDTTRENVEPLLAIEREQGLSAFLRLRTVEAWNSDPKMRAQVEELIERVSQALKAQLSDPLRIHKFIRNLNATEEERAFAIVELRRSGAAAAPYLIEALIEDRSAEQRASILSALPRLGRDIVPPFLAALDIEHTILRLDLIDYFQRIADQRVVPHLWYLSSSPQVANSVHKKARASLLWFLRVPPEKLPDPKAALTAEAERYYRHEVSLPAGEVVVWKFQDKKLSPHALSATQAEEYYGLKFAREALALDPSYEPAQLVFLSLALEKGIERGGIDRPLDQGAPEVQEMLKVVGPDLLGKALTRALRERRLPVILGTIRALGELADVRSSRDENQILVKALDYPDRRVQLAAADALLRIPASPPKVVHNRIVAVLRRAAGSDAVPKALVADVNTDRGRLLGRSLGDLGFEPIYVTNGTDALRALRDSDDIDVVFVDQGITVPELPQFLAQARADLHFGLLPLIVTVGPMDDQDMSHIPRDHVPADRWDVVKRLIRGYPHVWAEPYTADKDILKDVLQEKLAAAVGKPLSEEERKGRRAEALIWLKRMATGEISGFDIRPAEKAILHALDTDEIAPIAIEAAGRLPGRQPQRELARVTLDPARPASLRIAAAQELNRHVQQHGLALTNDQVIELEDVFARTTEPALRARLAVVLGTLRPDPAKAGTRLQQFTPKAPAKEK